MPKDINACRLWDELRSSSSLGLTAVASKAGLTLPNTKGMLLYP
jgi:hypothetical protein